MKRMLLGAAFAAFVLGGSAVMAAQNNANSTTTLGLGSWMEAQKVG